MIRSLAGQLDAFEAQPRPVERAPSPAEQPKRRRLKGPPIREAKHETEAERSRREAIEKLQRRALAPLRALARERRDLEKAPGVTADDVHRILKDAPELALLGSGQRATSWIGPWLRSVARLHLLEPFVLQGMTVKRASTRPEARRNPQVVYLDPEDRRVAGAGR